MFNFGDEKIVLKNKEGVFSQKDLKILLCPKINSLRSLKENNLLLTCDDNFEFILNFFAGILAGKELFLLSDSTKIKDFGNDFIKEVPADKNTAGKAIDFTEFDPKNIFINFYTSGSTGEPKCVRKSFDNVILEVQELKRLFPADDDSVFVTTLKLTHMFGFAFALIYPFYSGFIIDTDVIKFPEQIKADKYVFVSSPSFLDRMAKYDDNPYPPEYIYSAGDKLKSETFKYFAQKSKVVDIYGSTESGTIGYRTDCNDDYFTLFGDSKIQISENNTTVLQSSYFYEDKLILNDYIEQKGDKFKVLGRSDRILKVQEKRISAIELENYLNEHPLIINSYCMKTGEKVAAVVVLTEEGKEKLLKYGSVEIIKELKSHMKNFSSIIPQRWRFLSEIPKTQAGKTDRAKIEEIFNRNLSAPLIFDKKIKEDTAEIVIAFPRHSNFFNGHFPDVPVLPGVVQLLFAHYFAQDMFDIKLNDKKIKKIKFSRVIKPDKKILLKFKNNEKSLDFTYTDEEKPFSSGTFIK